MITDDEVFDGLRSHLDRFWPDRPHEEFVWTLGPIGESLPRFRVRRRVPRPALDMQRRRQRRTARLSLLRLVERGGKIRVGLEDRDQVV